MLHCKSLFRACHCRLRPPLSSGNLQVTFSNYIAGKWVLDWATEAAEGHLTPEAGGPLVSVCRICAVDASNVSRFKFET